MQLLEISLQKMKMMSISSKAIVKKKPLVADYCCIKYNSYKTTKKSKYDLLYQSVFKGVTKSLGNYGIYIVIESKAYRKEKKGNEEVSSNGFNGLNQFNSLWQ